VAYYAMLSFVSSFGSIAEMKENWFPAQTCPSLLLQKWMLHKWSLLSGHIFFLKWALNRHCKIPISDIAALTAFL
jgi:hypothetical protein